MVPASKSVREEPGADCAAAGMRDLTPPRHIQARKEQVHGGMRVRVTDLALDAPRDCLTTSGLQPAAHPQAAMESLVTGFL